MNESLITEQLNWRYATKKFDPSKKIEQKTWHTILESLRLSPSSFGLQPWKFIDVQDKELRRKLKEVSWNQSQVEEASHYIVLCYKETMEEAYIDKFIKSIADTRGTQVENLNSYKQMMVGALVKGRTAPELEVWASRQVYIALGQLMTSSAILGVDTCAMEGLDAKAYDKILKLEGSGYKTVVACAVGYRHSEDKYADAKKVRFSPNEIHAIK